MGLARNLSKFKPNSDGLVEANDIAPGAVSAGTVTATASGSIGAGKAVVVNANGTVSQCSGTFPNILRNNIQNTGQGYSFGFNTVGILESPKIALLNYYNNLGSPNNSFIGYDWQNNTFTNRLDVANTYIMEKTNVNSGILCSFANDSANGQIRVLSHSSGTITMGSPVTIGTISGSASGSTSITGYCKAGNYYLVAFRRVNISNNNEFSRIAVISFDGNSITVHSTSSEFTNESPQIMAFDPTTNKIVAFTLNQWTGSNFKIKVFGLSGTTLTELSSTTSASNPFSVANPAFTSSGRVLTNFRTNTGTYGFINGSNQFVTQTFSTAQSSSTPQINMSDDGRVIVNVSAAFGQEYTSLTTTSFTSWQWDSNTLGSFLVGSSSLTVHGYIGYSVGNNFVVCAATRSDGSILRVGVAEIGTTNAPLWVGINTASLTNGQSGLITVVGGENSQQSGLDTSATAYILGDGSISTTATTTVKAGIATSATKVLVKGNS